jgi:hypothetical protein
VRPPDGDAVVGLTIPNFPGSELGTGRGSSLLDGTNSNTASVAQGTERIVADFGAARTGSQLHRLATGRGSTPT